MARSEVDREADSRRASSTERGYNNAWRKAREGFLRSHPLCKKHQERGIVKPATVVDHIKPHKGDTALFWNQANWQALCKACHDGAKQREERGSVSDACELSGLPSDPRHPWNR